MFKMMDDYGQNIVILNCLYFMDEYTFFSKSQWKYSVINQIYRLV